MEALHTTARRGGVDHEAIWAPIGAVALLAARFFPFEGLSVGACPFRALTGLPCFSCGGTRAFMALTRLEIVDAVVMNPMAALLGTLAVAYVVHAMGVWLLGWHRWRPSVGDERARRALRFGAVAIILMNWTYLILVGR